MFSDEKELKKEPISRGWNRGGWRWSQAREWTRFRPCPGRDTACTIAAPTIRH